MPSNRIENEHTRQILEAIGSGSRITQRALSRELGVALGLTNLLIRRLVAKGYVKVSRAGTRHVMYLLTATGWQALGRATRMSLENTLNLYTATREQIRQALATAAQRCEPDAEGQKRVVFYGAGDVAEIAYVCLHSTDLTLVGVVDDQRTGSFFGMPIASPASLTADGLEGTGYEYVIVTSLRHAEAIRARLDMCAVPPDRVVWLPHLGTGMFRAPRPARRGAAG